MSQIGQWVTKPTNEMCGQRRLVSACVCAMSDQRFRGGHCVHHENDCGLMIVICMCGSRVGTGGPDPPLEKS